MLALLGLLGVGALCLTESAGVTKVGDSIERALTPEPEPPPAGYPVTAVRDFFPNDAKTEIERVFRKVTVIKMAIAKYDGGAIDLGTEIRWFGGSAYIPPP